MVEHSSGAKAKTLDLARIWLYLKAGTRGELSSEPGQAENRVTELMYGQRY